MSDQKTFLWVIPKWTLPATDGARVATDRLVKNMVTSGAKVDVMCLGNPGEVINIEDMKSQWKVENVYYKTRPIPKTKLGKTLFYLFKLITRPRCPLTMSTFDAYTIKDFVHRICKNKQYDYLFLDGLHLGAIFIENGTFRKPDYCKKVVYRAHNIEEDIWIKAYKDTSNLFKKILLKYQSKLVANYERAIIEGSDLIAPISVEDNQRIINDHLDVKTHITLMGMDFNHPLEYQDNDQIQFLFLGRLDWPPNKDGLKWLLENVWPKVNTDKFHLNVAGSGDRSWLKSYQDIPGVTFHGFVDDINDLYSRCTASLIPIFYGSGTRIKVVETYTKGRSMISTAMGAQGSGLVPTTDYTAAESIQEWIDAINCFDLDISKAQGVSGANRLKVEFDAQVVAFGLYNRLL